MAVQTESYIFDGGLDLEAPHLSRRLGQTLIDAVNYEALPLGGYRRIDGYELYDGQATGMAAPAGSGPIRGVWVYQNTGYCIRDNAGGTAAVLFKATGAGWVAQTLSSYLLFDGGTTAFVEGETINGQTSGATGVVRRIARNSGSLGASSLTGLVVLSGVTGTFQNNENLRAADLTVRAVADGTLTAHTLAAGGSYYFWNYNFLGNASSQRMYAAGGVDYAFEWDGTYSAPILQKVGSNFPSHIVAHSAHLFLGFGTDGILRNSSTGLPLDYISTTGAVDTGVGDIITNLRPNVGGVLFVACKTSVQILYGTSSADWVLKRFSDHGGRARTMKEIGGSFVILDARGVQRIDQSQAFGDFQSVSLSVAINRRLLPIIQQLSESCAVVSKNKDQYRLFFGRVGYYLSFRGGKLVGIMPVVLQHNVVVAAEGEDTGGLELILFGDNSGNVFRMNKLTTFNGTAIRGQLSMRFHSSGEPTRDKQYRRAVFYMDVEGATPTLSARASFEFGSGDVPASGLMDIVAGGGEGSEWDVGDWDTFEWAGESNIEASVTLDGTAQNMSLTIFSTGSGGIHTFQSGAIHYSPRRLNR